MSTESRDGRQRPVEKGENPVGDSSATGKMLLQFLVENGIDPRYFLAMYPKDESVGPPSQFSTMITSALLGLDK